MNWTCTRATARQRRSDWNEPPIRSSASSPEAAVDLKPPRGTQDLLPPEGSRMRALSDRAAGVARLHGYQYVETPAFESTELFTRTSGESSDIVRKERYTFEDRGK